MTVPLARKARLLKQTISRRRPKRRDDSGLTTLEWLLIVAAVAGLAALAVVLVTNVVGETSEQIAGQSARLTAARLAAEEVTIDARDATKPATPTPEQVKTFNSAHKKKCKRLSITYGDIEDMKVFWVKDISGVLADPPVYPTVDVDIGSDADWDVTKIGCYLGVNA